MIKFASLDRVLMEVNVDPVSLNGGANALLDGSVKLAKDKQTNVAEHTLSTLATLDIPSLLAIIHTMLNASGLFKSTEEWECISTLINSLLKGLTPRALLTDLEFMTDQVSSTDSFLEFGAEIMHLWMYSLARTTPC